MCNELLLMLKMYCNQVFFCQLIHSLFIQNQELLLHTQLLKDCYNSQFPGTFNENLPYYSSIKGYTMRKSKQQQDLSRNSQQRFYLFEFAFTMCMTAHDIPSSYEALVWETENR